MAENVLIVKKADVKKSIYGTYSAGGARFRAVICPERLSFFGKRRLKRYMNRFKGGYLYSGSSDDLFPVTGFHKTDGSLCICENIEPLCRKICKNRNIRMPPTVGICDADFTETSARIAERLGRMCSELYLFTKNTSAYSYIDYMSEEYGCILCVRENFAVTDILISADKLETDSYNAVVIDLFGRNDHIMTNRVSELYFSTDGFDAEDKNLLGNVICGRLYDFLRISGMKYGQNVNFIGYG